MNRVLILEDEGVLRASMARGIGKLPGVEVVDAGTFAEALRFIDEKPPKLILSDLDLPDRSGLELLGALGARGLRIPIVFITAYLKAYGSQIPPHANVEVREKPIALDELRKLVKTYLQDTSSSPFSVADYLQIAAMGSHSVEITLERDDGRSGRIIVFGGALWSSSDERGAGPDSFKRLALLQNAFITCAAVRGEPGERNVYENLEHLLLEAAREQDEAERDLVAGFEASLSAPATVDPELDFSDPAPQFSEPAPHFTDPAAHFSDSPPNFPDAESAYVDASSLFSGLLDPEPAPQRAKTPSPLPSRTPAPPLKPPPVKPPGPPPVKPPGPPSVKPPGPPSVKPPGPPSAKTPAPPLAKTPAPPLAKTPAPPLAKTPAPPLAKTPASLPSRTPSSAASMFQLKSPAPPLVLEPRPTPVPPPQEEDFDTLWQQASEALLDKKYTIALEFLRRAHDLRPDDPKVSKYIEKLSNKKD
jgi:CheY-like chemotaxis protein